jgi:hypothetical protein
MVAAVLVFAAAALPPAATAHPIPLTGSSEGGWLAAPQVAEECPTKLDAERFAGADELFRANGRMAAFGRRPTGSPAHERFVDYVAARLRALRDVRVESLPYPIRRQTPTTVALDAHAPGRPAEPVRVAGELPYSKPTTRSGVTAPLVYVPPEQTLADVDVRGKIVVRDAVTVSVPNAAIAALQWFTYDPELVLTRTIGESYERENAGEARVNDLRAAGERGAAGLIFVHGFPHEQKKGQYAPYEGVQWPVPAVFLGADEGRRVKQLAAQGGTARLVHTARVERVETRMLVATLPGLSDEKIVVQSHTDGMNAVWDNGPIAMLAMAEYFDRLGKGCRPRTLQFAFTTAHLYQHLVPPDRDGSAEQFAKRIDREYDNGKVALVLAMEHMGARGWKAVPRGGGRPGRVLEHAERNEPTSMFMGESPALISTAAKTVAEHDLRETIALRGADLPGLQIPPHDNYGGEGNPYQHHLLPTIALITAPWTLFDPAFGLEELVDRDLLHRQTLVFSDLVHAFSVVPREVLGGGYVGYREARRLTCGTALEALNLVRHCNGP